MGRFDDLSPAESPEIPRSCVISRHKTSEWDGGTEIYTSSLNNRFEVLSTTVFSQQPFWVNWLCFRIGWSPPRLLKLDEFWLLSVRMSHTHDLMMLWIIIRFKMLFLVCIIDLMIKVKCLVWIGAIPNLRFWFTGSHSPLFERLQPKYRKMQVEIQWSNITDLQGNDRILCILYVIVVTDYWI